MSLSYSHSYSKQALDVFSTFQSIFLHLFFLPALSFFLFFFKQETSEKGWSQRSLKQKATFYLCCYQINVVYSTSELYCVCIQLDIFSSFYSGDLVPFTLCFKQRKVHQTQFTIIFHFIFTNEFQPTRLMVKVVFHALKCQKIDR